MPATVVFDHPNPAALTAYLLDTAAPHPPPASAHTSTRWRPPSVRCLTTPRPAPRP
ncbi:acyl carrier protein [Streptomyces diastatochromogenes]|nr:acyl carrier protein [Streptomyces diastatochromogenes]